MISVYVSSNLRYLLQTQVEVGLLSSLICLSISKKLEDIDDDLCEWRPLKSLLIFSRSITNKENHMFSSIDRKTGNNDDSFLGLLGKAKSLPENEHNSQITTSFSLSMLCASPDLLLQHFPSIDILFGIKKLSFFQTPQGFASSIQKVILQVVKYFNNQNSQKLIKLNAGEGKIVKKPSKTEHHLWNKRDSAASGQKALNLVRIVCGLPNEKDAVYGELDKWTAWETEFPVIAVAKALNILKQRKQWKRVIQVYFH